MPVCDLDNRLPHAKTVLGLIWWRGGIGTKVHGRCSTICVLTDWLHFLKGGLISGGGCNVCIMVGVLMALESVSSFLRLLWMALRYTHPRELVHQYVQVLSRMVFCGFGQTVIPNTEIFFQYRNLHTFQS
ncbi:hypothetical protein LINPERHAP1_LOCUS13114 [Linum perenne]